MSAHKENLRRADGPSQRDLGLPLVLEASLYMNEVASALASALYDKVIR